jgi:hypothetical protein
MRITIAERLRPYSHLPGTFFLIPGSSLRAQIFPARIRIEDLSGQQPIFFVEIALNLKGPLAEFTVLQDLEKGYLRVWGHSLEGFVRYRITAFTQGKGIAISVEKTPRDGMVCSCRFKNGMEADFLLHPKDMVVVKDGLAAKSEEKTYTAPATDRLFLGSQKAQDWELIRRRSDLAEIFPFWHRLGQLVPQITCKERSGTATLLDVCRERIATGRSHALLEPFRHLYLAGFEGGLSPRLSDSDHQGIFVPEVPVSVKITPLILLSEGAEFIRSLFVQHAESSIRILPALPSEFHCGRLLHVYCGQLGDLDLEWSKKQVRRVCFRAQRTGQFDFSFQKEVKKFRLRQSNKDRGKAVLSGSPVPVEAGHQYWFDNFKA